MNVYLYTDNRSQQQQSYVFQQSATPNNHLSSKLTIVFQQSVFPKIFILMKK